MSLRVKKADGPEVNAITATTSANSAATPTAPTQKATTAPTSANSAATPTANTAAAPAPESTAPAQKAWYLALLEVIKTPFMMLYWWFQHECWQCRFFYGIFTKRVINIDQAVWDCFRQKVTMLGVPVDFYLRYLNSEAGRAGSCFERSYLMFLCLEGSVLVRGKVRGIASHMRSWEEAEHGWVEYNGKCYDPNDLLVYDRDFYYQLEKVREASYRTYAEELTKNGNGYGEAWVSKDDLKPGGSQRHLVATALGIIETLRRTKRDTGFRYNFIKFLEEIEYSRRDALQATSQYVAMQNVIEEEGDEA